MYKKSDQKLEFMVFGEDFYVHFKLEISIIQY